MVPLPFYLFSWIPDLSRVLSAGFLPFWHSRKCVLWLLSQFLHNCPTIDAFSANQLPKKTQTKPHDTLLSSWGGKWQRNLAKNLELPCRLTLPVLVPAKPVIQDKDWRVRNPRKGCPQRRLLQISLGRGRSSYKKKETRQRARKGFNCIF